MSDPNAAVDAGAGGGSAPGDLERAIEQKLDEMWETAGRLTQSDMSMPAWVRTRMLAGSRFGQVNRLVTPHAVASSTGAEVTLADVRLVLARNLAATRGDWGAIVDTGVQLANDLDGLMAQPEPPSGADILTLLHSWLSRVPPSVLHEGHVLAIVANLVRFVADEPASLGAAANVLSLMPRGEPDRERARWLAHKRLLDEVFDSADAALLADPELQAVVAEVAAQLATATSIVRRHLGGPSPAAVEMVRRCNVVAAVYEPNPLTPDLEQGLQQILGVQPTGQAALVTWWSLRSGRWLIDQARTGTEVAAIDSVTASVAAAMRGGAEAASELVRILDVAGTDVSADMRLLLSAAAVELVLRAGPRIVDALVSDVALAALPHLSRALGSTGHHPDNRLRSVETLVLEISRLPRWGPVSLRSTARIAEAMGVLRGSLTEALPVMSESELNEEFDPGTFIAALGDLLRGLTDVELPQNRDSAVLAEWEARLTWRLRAEVAPSPTDYERAFGLRALVDAQPDGPAGEWDPESLDEAEIVDVEDAAWLDNASLLIADSRPVGDVVRSILGDAPGAGPAGAATEDVTSDSS